MKRIIIYLVIISFLHLTGCYYQEQMTPGEYKFDENLDLQVTTKDTTFSISSEDYYYADDTLYVNVLKPLNERTNVKVKVNIPKTEIEKVEVTKTDIAGTTWIVAVITAVIVIFLINEKFDKMEKD